MREFINLIDDNAIEVKGYKYTREDSSLVYILHCLTNEYDDLKIKYDRLVEQHEKVLKITKIEGEAYVMSFIDLASALEINKQTLVQVSCRAEFDKYRTYVTQPRQRPAFIVTKKSLQLLYIYLKECSRIKFSQIKFNKLLRNIINGYSCEG